MVGRMDGVDPFGSRLEGVDPLSWSVFRTWRETDKLNRALFVRSLAQRGGHPGQAMCLWVLASHDGISQRELAEIMHLAPPTVTAMMQKMERHGLIERRADERDQRLTRLTLTEAGRAAAAEMRAAQAVYVNDTVGALSPEDQREFERLLRALATSMHAALGRLGDLPADWHGHHHGFGDEGERR